MRKSIENAVSAIVALLVAASAGFSTLGCRPKPKVADGPISVLMPLRPAAN